MAVSVKMTVVRPFLETAKGLGAIVNTDLSIRGENPHPGAVSAMVSLV